MHTLLLPGLMCDDAVWAGQRDALARRGGVSVADYGTLDSLPAMASAVLRSAPPSFVVVGHSMGGRVALEVVRQAPDRVRGLGLLDTGYQAREPGPAGDDERAKRMALVDVAQRDGMRAMGMQWVQGMVHPDRLADSALLDAILAMIERRTPEVFAAQQRALLARPDAGALLGAIRCPTLVLCGREDAWSPPARHEDMAGRIAGARLAIIERSGHMVTMEQPAAVADVLGAWLDGIARG